MSSKRAKTGRRLTRSEIADRGCSAMRRSSALKRRLALVRRSPGPGTCTGSRARRARWLWTQPWGIVAVVRAVQAGPGSGPARRRVVLAARGRAVLVLHEGARGRRGRGPCPAARSRSAARSVGAGLAAGPVAGVAVGATAPVGAGCRRPDVGAAVGGLVKSGKARPASRTTKASSRRPPRGAGSGCVRGTSLLRGRAAARSAARPGSWGLGRRGGVVKE